MKKSQLRQIIRESINELMNEQSNSNVTVSVGDIVAVAAVSPNGLTNPQDLPSPGVQPGPFITLFGGNFQNQSFGSSMSMSHNCGYSETHTIDSQAFADEFNNLMSGQVGVYIEIASSNTGAYQALQSVWNQMNADFSGNVGSCTYVGPTFPTSPVMPTSVSDPYGNLLGPPAEISPFDSPALSKDKPKPGTPRRLR